MSRQIKFEYHLLDHQDRFKKILKTVMNCSIDYKSLGEIKRKASISISEDDSINYLSDRIQPFIILDNIKYSMGIFLLNSPIKNINSISVKRDIECFDKTQILLDDKISTRYFIPKNTNVVGEIAKILTLMGLTYNITSTDKVLQRDLEFSIGTSKLEIINTLLDTINYYSVRVDINGVFISSPYILPDEAVIDFTYITDNKSVILDDVEEELDLFAVPNKFVAVVSNPEQPPLQAVYTNENSNSPVSTISRGRIISDEVRELENIADQDALNHYIMKIAYESSQVYGKVRFSTWINPSHEYLNTLRFKFMDEIDAVFQETSWSMDLVAGGRMTHECRRVVNV